MMISKFCMLIHFFILQLIVTHILLIILMVHLLIGNQNLLKSECVRLRIRNENQNKMVIWVEGIGIGMDSIIIYMFILSWYRNGLLLVT